MAKYEDQTLNTTGLKLLAHIQNLLLVGIRLHSLNESKFGPPDSFCPVYPTTKQLSLLLINTLLASQAFSQDNSEQVRKINELLAESNSLASELYNEGNFSQSKRLRLKVSTTQID